MSATARKKNAKVDWSAADAMTDEERHAATMADPDARPMTEKEWAAAPRVPRTITLRRALRLSQQEFAEQYCIPIGTLRDWEQDRKEPDAAAKAYLYVIAGEPEMVCKASPRDRGRSASRLRAHAVPRMPHARRLALRRRRHRG